MRKTVSIAIFGEGVLYSRYLPAFVRAHLNLFPIEEEWRLRIHCDNVADKTESGRAIVNLSKAGLVDAVFMGTANYTRAMLWRMSPVFEVESDYVFCRDLDCCPMPRDRAVMEQFIKSGATVHTVHDNVLHFDMMGGLCGFHAASFREATGFKSLEQLCAYGEQIGLQWTHKGADQRLLNHVCLRPGGPTLLEHRFNGWHSGPAAQFPKMASGYPCVAYSAPVPDNGISRFSGELAERADRLANHLGAAGFDFKAAVKFYDEHGDPAIARAVAECEEAAR